MQFQSRSRTLVGSLLALTGSLCLAPGCSVKLDVPEVDLSDVEKLRDDALDLWDDITELSEPEDSFKSRVMVLGRSSASDGSSKLYLQGANASGTALTESDFDGLQIFVDGQLVHGCQDMPADTTGSAPEPPEPPDGSVASPQTGDSDAGTEDLDGLDAGTAASPPAPDPTETCLALAGVDVKFLAELEGTVFSISVVNDYSGSMLDEDLKLVSDIHTTLFEALPPVFETEVVYFSEVAETVQLFTDDRSNVLNAVKADLTYDRGLTALYDGMGAGLTSLIAQDAPVRILMVSSDGYENSSELFTKSELTRTIKDNGIVTVMLGSRYANVAEMKAFAAGRGVFFYTPAFSQLKQRVSAYVESLLGTAELALPAELDGKNVEVRVDGIPAEL